MIHRLLIANRGEIAVRIARGAHELGIVPLGIYSQADADAYHLRFVDDALCVGPPAAAASYLNTEAIIAAAKSLHADAIHPGYGFLSERAAFAAAVIDAGLIFVGPTPEAMATMGSKIEAKHCVRKAGVPTVPGYDGDERAPAQLLRRAERIGFPILIKASAGGGGRGMRVVDTPEQFDEALQAAKREALAAFGDDAVLLERYLTAPRHIEFQVLADMYGKTIHLGERECSIQRRHQKIIEEAPSVALTPELRTEMGAAAVRAAQAVGYVNAGTIEFMLDEDGSYYFLEMNTRLQVEHPVTELVHGVDLVHWQLRIAGGQPLTLEQDEIRPRGWAIEARIYAEDPAQGMLPSIGTISQWEAPQGPGIRVDAGVCNGSDVSIYYDSMLAKLIAFDSDRPAAIVRLDAALRDLCVEGIRTNVPLLLWIARQPQFRAGQTTTRFLDDSFDASIFAPRAVDDATLLAAVGGLLSNGWMPWRIGDAGIPLALAFGDAERTVLASRLGTGRWQLEGALQGECVVTQRGELVQAQLGELKCSARIGRNHGGFLLHRDGETLTFAFAPPPSTEVTHAAGATDGAGTIRAPMPGKIAKVAVGEGEAVDARALLVVLEAMKMEHRIEATGKATVGRVLVREGEIVSAGTALVELT